MSLKTYDPARVQINVAGHPISGFMDGRFIDLEPGSPTFEDEIGVDGEPVRWLTYDPLFNLYLDLVQTAEDNAFLSNLRLGDSLSQAILFPVLLVDGSNPADTQPTRMVAPRAWIKTQPAIIYESGSPVGRRWQLRLLNVVLDIRGTSAA